MNHQRLFLTLCALFGMSYMLRGQAVVYSENFNNGCSDNCLATGYPGWTVQNNIGGTNGGSPNNWYVSCAEDGVLPPGCGSTCLGDASLHIGADLGGGGDMGATFNETGATNATFRRAVSPTINLTGFSTNTLAFDFIAYGSAACSDDRAQLHLSTDNGATWPVGFQYCLNSVCCGACNGYSQGQWTVYTLALPAAFNNNPNVRVGFHWRNNGNGSGTDPSVAIDDVRITTTITPVNLVSFNAKEFGKENILEWTAAAEVRLKHYEIESGAEPNKLEKIATVSARGGQGGAAIRYRHTDPTPVGDLTYYRLKMVDQDGSFSHSQVVRVARGQTEALTYAGVTHIPQENVAQLNLWAADNMTVEIVVFDPTGKSIQRLAEYNLLAGENLVKINSQGFAAGAYMAQVKTKTTPKGFEPFYGTRKFVLAN